MSAVAVLLPEEALSIPMKQQLANSNWQLAEETRLAILARVLSIRPNCESYRGFARSNADRSRFGAAKDRGYTLISLKDASRAEG